MGKGRLRIRKREPREQSCPCHAGSELEIPGIADHGWKHVEDLESSRPRKFSRHRIDVAVPDTFKRMRQGVEAGRDRQTLRHRERQLRIDDRCLRIEFGSRERVLPTVLGIPQRRPHRDLAAGSRGGRHGDDGQPAQVATSLFRLEIASNPGEVAVCRGESLGRVNDRPSPNGDDDLCGLARPGPLLTRFRHGREIRVWLHVVDHQLRRSGERLDSRT